MKESLRFERKDEIVLVDSIMSVEAARAQNPHLPCPEKILEQQEVLFERYLTPDGKLHEGQIVVHRELAEDVTRLFERIRAEGFPVASVIPLADRKFKWDDEQSMMRNNTSGFNYRPIAGTNRLSRHAEGRAIDINPWWNPMVRTVVPGERVIVEPEGAHYDPRVPGTIVRGDFITEFLKQRGWKWGGEWTSLKDYQHFEK